MNTDEVIYYTPTQLTTLDGYIQTTVPNKFRDRILSEISTTTDPVNKELIGHIKTQNSLTKLKDDKEWFEYIKQVCESFAAAFPQNSKLYQNTLVDDFYVNSLTLDLPWVNRMKKTEFNPFHSHRGLYSYVIWVEIPYDLEDEKNYFPDPNNKVASTFHFMMACDHGITNHMIDVDKTFEWEMVLFPSTLQHCVYPFFTSEGERVSVAGNVMYKPN